MTRKFPGHFFIISVRPEPVCDFIVIFTQVREKTGAAILYAAGKNGEVPAAVGAVKRTETEKAVYLLRSAVAGIEFAFAVFEKFIAHIKSPK